MFINNKLFDILKPNFSVYIDNLIIISKDKYELYI